MGARADINNSPTTRQQPPTCFARGNLFVALRCRHLPAGTSISPQWVSNCLWRVALTALPFICPRVGV
eukprot:7709539-Lingulodinium_polyedra.AAC.1